MSKRWTLEEDTKIKKQLKRGIAISAVHVAGRNAPGIRKRAIRVGLIKKSLRAKICAPRTGNVTLDRRDHDSVAANKFESRGDPEAAMIAEARERLRQAEARGELIRRDPFVTALFGQYRPGYTYLPSAGAPMKPCC